MALVREIQTAGNAGQRVLCVGQQIFRDFDFLHQHITHRSHVKIFFENPAEVVRTEIKFFCQLSQRNFTVDIVVNVTDGAIHEFRPGIDLQQGIFLANKMDDRELRCK